MRAVGCAVGKEDCLVLSCQESNLVNAHVFVCIFDYKKCVPVTNGVATVSADSAMRGARGQGGSSPLG